MSTEETARDYDPKRVTPLTAAVIDAITASMEAPDSESEASQFVTALKAAGFVIIRDPNRPRVPYSDKRRTDA